MLKNQDGKDIYDMALNYGHDDLASRLERYMNQTLNYESKKFLLLMRQREQTDIAKVPKDLFRTMLKYL